MCDTETDSEEKLNNKAVMTNDKICIVVIFCIMTVSQSLFYSLMGPFFPNEAAIKGSSTVVTGWIIGVYELTVVIMCPVFGTFITKLGAKFLFCGGALIAGFSNILFGFLERSPDGPTFIVMCFMIRTMEGVGAAAFGTSCYSIMAHTFPTNAATMIGLLEMFAGIGIMVGFPIGGALFQVGGFLLPFTLMGGLAVVLGFVSIFILPSVQDLTIEKGGSVLSLLRIPLVTIMALYLAVGSVAVGFITIGVSPWLETTYNLTPLMTGLVFMAGPGAYAVTAIFWGCCGDTHPNIAKTMLFVGYIMGAVAFIMLGPAPFIPLRQDILALFIAMLTLSGFGIASLMITFIVMAEASKEAGYPESLETYGLISGLFNSFFSIGAFAGPPLGGYLIQQFDFPTASVFVAGAMGLMVVILGVYMITEYFWTNSAPTNEERARLLATSSGEIQMQTLDSG